MACRKVWISFLFARHTLSIKLVILLLFYASSGIGTLHAHRWLSKQSYRPETSRFRSTDDCESSGWLVNNLNLNPEARRAEVINSISLTIWLRYCFTEDFFSFHFFFMYRSEWTPGIVKLTQTRKRVMAMLNTLGFTKRDFLLNKPLLAFVLCMRLKTKERRQEREEVERKIEGDRRGKFWFDDFLLAVRRIQSKRSLYLMDFFSNDARVAVIL